MNHDATGLRPTFLVIGAYKAGTTSSHHYLKQHPQVFMSQRKEIRFLTYAGHERLRLSPVEFASLPWPVQTLPAYEALFAEATEKQARGDVSLFQQRRASKSYRTLSYTTAPELDPALRSELTALYRDDILRTQDLIGRDLGHWLEQA